MAVLAGHWTELLELRGAAKCPSVFLPITMPGTTQPIQKLRWWRHLSLGLLACGWLLSAYLLLRMATIGAVALPFKPVVSAYSVGPGCDDALADVTSFVRAFPLPGLGLIYFAVIGVLLAFGSKWATRLAFLVCAGGLGASIFLSAKAFSSGGPVCLPYPIVDGVNLALLTALFMMVSRQPPGEDARPSPMISSKAWVVMALVTMTATVLLQAAIVRPDRDSKDLIRQYRAEPLFEISRQTSDAVLGPSNGRVRLVVFSSFQCPWCRKLAPTLHYLNGRFGDSLTIVFKHFPLGEVGNPALKTEAQPRAWKMAFAAEAANLQESFWRYHDGLSSSSLQDADEILEATARRAGLDLKRWEEDRQSPAVRLKVVSDVQLGLRLGIVATPTLFLNGRRVKNPNLIVLTTLIREQLKSAP